MPVQYMLLEYARVAPNRRLIVDGVEVKTLPDKRWELEVSNYYTAHFRDETEAKQAADLAAWDAAVAALIDSLDVSPVADEAPSGGAMVKYVVLGRAFTTPQTDIRKSVRQAYSEAHGPRPAHENLFHK